MNYSSYTPHNQISPWHDSFYDSSDTSSISSSLSRRPSTSTIDTPTLAPPRQSFHISKRKSRRTSANAQDRARERIRELEQRIRELESSGSETTARATIKVLQTRVRDLEAEVDCLSMRLLQAERAMATPRAEGPAVPENLFNPMLTASMSTASSGTQAAYIAALPFTNPSVQMAQAQAQAHAEIPRSAVRPLINWTIPALSPKRPAGVAGPATQRPAFLSQQTAIWRGLA